MTKLKTVMLSVSAISLVASSVVCASTESVIDEIYSIGSQYGMTASHKVELERLVESEAQANELLVSANQIDAIMVEAGITDITELSSEDLASVKSIANEAASVVGVLLSFVDGSVELYKDGVLVGTFNNDGTLAYTGNTAFLALATSATIIAAAAIVLNVKKRV